ncbi:hypothetical protein OV083_04985 [Pseudomonas aeruginosa]|nr:hypothetical protein [Pseudomonas aeruginosa]MCY0304376.1 hypothetical protein [Pseudomonas aeruginosa]
MDRPGRRRLPRPRPASAGCRPRRLQRCLFPRRRPARRGSARGAPGGRQPGPCADIRYVFPVAPGAGRDPHVGELRHPPALPAGALRSGRTTPGHVLPGGRYTSGRYPAG